MGIAVPTPNNETRKPSLEVAPTTLATFSFCDRELYMALPFELDLDSVKIKQHARYIGQRSFSSKAIVHTHRHTHTLERLFYEDHQTDW